MKVVCKGSTIKTDEQSLQEFYSDLINFKMVVESANATHLLNAMATSEEIFSRFPRNLQEKLAELALRKGYDMNVVHFDLFIEFIDHSQRLASSRLGRLMKTSKENMTLNSPRWVKPKPYRALTVQMVDKDNSSPSYSSKDVKKALRDSRSCAACESTAHLIWRCEKFANSLLRERKLVVKQKRLCFNCLGLEHEVKACPSKARCRTCAKLHHSLLHPSLSNGQASLEPPKQGTSEDAKGPASASANCVSADPTLGSKEVASISSSCITNVRGRLQVLPVCIINPANGKGQEIFALLDSGADTHLLSRRVYTELGLQGKPVRSRLQLADGSVKVSDTFDTSLKVRGVDEEVSFSLDNVRVVNALPRLTGSIPSQEDLMQNEHLADINIPIIIQSNCVDLLLGMSSPALHIFSEIREGSNSYLWAGKSPLGWVLFGSE